MITVNLQPSAVEVESLGHWRLNGEPVEPGTCVTVLPGLAADLVARGKARRVVKAAPAVEPVVEPVADDAPPPDPETPPAPAVPARGKK